LIALDPDWIILSIGTNDANSRYFKPEEYRQNYDSLISVITEAVPDAAILITVPNDSYLYRRYVNRNTDEVKKVIEQMAAKYNCGVWDFYTIMGGLNSINAWQQFNLAKRDGIHFTVNGYILIGDLFFDAFLRSYEDHLSEKKDTVIR
jgi:lysophospholipase L1-like esterase